MKGSCEGAVTALRKRSHNQPWQTAQVLISILECGVALLEGTQAAFVLPIVTKVSGEARQ